MEKQNQLFDEFIRNVISDKRNQNIALICENCETNINYYDTSTKDAKDSKILSEFTLVNVPKHCLNTLNINTKCTHFFCGKECAQKFKNTIINK